MEEFLKIKWTIDDPSELEKQPEFIKEEVLSQSLIYKNFDKPIKELFVNPLKKNKKVLTVNGKKCIPGEQHYFEHKEFSFLNEKQHEHCLKAYELLRSGKSPADYSESETFFINTFNELKPKIIQENELYQKKCMALWKNNVVSLKPVNCSNNNYTKYIWTEQCNRYLNYGPKFKEISSISLTYTEEDGAVEYKCLSNILEVGILAKFTHPSFKTKCLLPTNSLPRQTAKMTSQLEVSKDKHIKKLLEHHKIDVVISNGGLKCLMDNTNPKSIWDIPILVKEIEINQDCKTFKKKVVFIDKPLPIKTPNRLDIINICMKKLIKTNLCEYEAFQYPVPDIPADMNAEERNKLEHQGNVEKKRIIHHNAQYRLWNIKKVKNQHNLLKNTNEDSNINLLIRSKLTGCEIGENGALMPVILRPKTEQQLKLGANIPSKSDLSREWTSLFFTPYSNLYRARVNTNPAELVKIEKCSIQKVVNEAWVHYKYKPHFGLGVLQKILGELLKLDYGEYLLHHVPKSGAFASLMKKCDESAPDGLNLSNLFEERNVDLTLDNIPWLPIDVNFVLPVLEAKNRLPAMFTPLKPRKDFFKFKNKGKKKKGVKKSGSKQ
ncbi:unnamed protein product [Brassicogethes aeneus]|uniref:Little elongation complex subunit 2 C-terminal domain-containing protein n=1 Tax=Brassicogethes aeneus TaxID=1431903 RepID=A0A9P0B6W0_BRAAE|nr:unnamed protein product [Brassicogethes aeneus]